VRSIDFQGGVIELKDISSSFSVRFDARYPG